MSDNEDITKFEGTIRRIGEVQYDLTNPEDTSLIVECNYRDGREKDDGTPMGFEFTLTNTPIPLLDRWFTTQPRIGDATDVYIATENNLILRVDYPYLTMAKLLSRIEELEGQVAGADGILH